MWKIEIRSKLYELSHPLGQSVRVWVGVCCTLNHVQETWMSSLWHTTTMCKVIQLCVSVCLFLGLIVMWIPEIISYCRRYWFNMSWTQLTCFLCKILSGFESSSLVSWSYSFLFLSLWTLLFPWLFPKTANNTMNLIKIKLKKKKKK